MIEVIKYTPFQKGSIIGFVDIIYNGEIKRHIPHLQKGERKWFNYPSYQEEDAGEKIYLAYWEKLIPEENTKFFKELTDKVKDFLDKKPAESQEFEGGDLPF